MSGDLKQKEKRTKQKSFHKNSNEHSLKVINKMNITYAVGILVFSSVTQIFALMHNS
jgi:hypothetical protein